MRIYRLAKGWAIFIYIFLFLAIAGLGWAMASVLAEGNPDEVVYWLKIGGALTGIAVSIFFIGEVKKDTFVIATDRVYTTGTFFKRALNLDEIRGFSVDENYIFIEPTTENKKRIRVSTYFGSTDDIVDWLSQRYPNLDEVTIQQEQNEILANPEFGWSEEQRGERLQRARRLALTVNVFGGIAAVVAFFLPGPNLWSMTAAIAMFMIALLASKLSNGLIRLDEKKNSAYPTVFYAIIFTGASVMVRTLMDFNVLDFRQAWILTGAITALLIVLIVFKNSELKFRTGSEIFTSIFIVVVLMAYSFGTAVALNGLLDTSTPEIFTVKIVRKHVSSGKTRTYYLTLEPWGGQKEQKDAKVSSRFYRSVEPGESVSLYRMKGKFGIPWFFIAGDKIPGAKANP
ncbi:hypothetical protein [Chryseolinea soli]|uniref:Uncharacterized protein n=1 Tax=Chryseolinea soli TaxID=2321403 RepID=A0A385SDC6_9BACT|nr:hypothetical protein [Chryseolinea soli]AYB29653.1 hypothetical protein D4L85_03220 [Chryseolinea soli]